MFKNRKLTVTVDKKQDASQENTKPEVFERKVDHATQKLESLAAKMFLGVCVYILLDTYRQVSIEQAKHQ